MSLSDLRSRIAAFDAMLGKGKSVPGYGECIRSVLGFEARNRYWGRPYYPYQSGTTMPSGFPAGTAALRYQHFRDSKPTFEDISLDGASKDLFEIIQIEKNDGVVDGYFEVLTAVRPLPFGDYRIERYFSYPSDELCSDFMPNGFTLQRYGEMTISVEGSIEGTVHEAFFDPGSPARGTGFSENTGVLRPASFTVGNTPTTIRRLVWRFGTVVMKLEPYVSLMGFEIDIIDLDGSVRRTLSVAHAVVDSGNGTLTWSEPEQPWNKGTRLMLRIRPEGSVPPAPDPRPWIPEVVYLTAKAGMQSRQGSSVPIVTLEWAMSDAVESDGWAQLQLWDGSTKEWRNRSTNKVLWGINPGSHTIRLRYTRFLETDTEFFSDYFVSEWKYVSVVVPGEPVDSHAMPTPRPNYSYPVALSLVDQRAIGGGLEHLLPSRESSVPRRWCKR